MALPTFLIIGAAKTGTTSLHYYLDQHPEIQMSRVKEPHFFVEPRDLPRYLANAIGTLEEYEALFDSRAAVRGEASPSYTEFPVYKGVPERISGLLPDAKFIYLVRDPVARTASHFAHRTVFDGERRTMREALAGAEDPKCLPFVCPSLYATQLERYLSFYPIERFLVLDQADLLRDRDAVLQEAFAFLGVNPEFESGLFAEELGTTKERRIYPQRYLLIARRIRSSPMRRLPRPVRRLLLRSVERALWPPVEPPELTSDVRGLLESLFGREVERFRELTGKGFATWAL
jgi:hypothetical protein